MGNINLSRDFIRGHSKSTSLCKIAFFDPRSSVSCIKKWQTMAWHRKIFFSIYGFLSISHIKGCRNHIISKDLEKWRNCCYKLCVHSPFHIDAQVLTSHFRKMVELWCFGCDSIAISEAHITFWVFFIVAHCNIIGTY